MMKAAKLGWAGPGAGQEQGRDRAGAELRIWKQSREEGRSWVGTGEKLGMCRIGVCKEQGRSTAGVGQKQELGRSREREREGEGETMMMTTMTMKMMMMKTIITKREK